MKRGDEIKLEGETWRVLAVGAVVGSCTYLHVAHATRGTQGRAGFIPVQECGWFDGESLHERPPSRESPDAWGRYPGSG